MKSPPPLSFLPPEFLARYTPLEVLGEGTSGLVIRAHQTNLDRVVVVKILKHEKIRNAVDRERFQQEARLLARHPHSHILAILDFGTVSRISFMVYPDDQGLTLEKIAPRGEKMPIRDLLRVLRHVLSGLEHLHRNGILHRDLKPENILLKEDGSWAIFDLGLAKNSASEAGLTATGCAMGTPLYMAPDQVLGTPPTQEDDLYSLGVIAYELLSGANPFHSGSLTECMAKQQHFVPPGLHQLDPEIPRDLSDLVERLMAKAREDRPLSAGEVRREVEAIARAQPPALSVKNSTPRESRPPEAGSRPRQRRWRGPYLVALSLFLGVLFLGWWRSLPPAPGPALTSDIPLLKPPRAPSVFDPWPPRLSQEFHTRADLLPRDPAQWDLAAKQLPQLTSFLQWFHRDGGQSSMPAEVRESLEDLGGQYRSMGFPDPLHALLVTSPSPEFVQLPESEWKASFPSEVRKLRVRGWGGTALKTYLEGLERLRLRSQDVDLLLRGERPLEPMPRLVENTLLQHRFPLGMCEESRRLGFAVTLLWQTSPEVRLALNEWLEVEHRLLARLTFASARVLAEESPQDQAVSSLLAYWRTVLGPFAFGPSNLAPPSWSLRLPPQSPQEWLYLGILELRKLRAYFELKRIPRETAEATFEILENAMVPIPASRELTAYHLLGAGDLLTRATVALQRPDLLLTSLKRKRALLQATPEIAPSCLCQWAQALEGFLPRSKVPAGLSAREIRNAFRQELEVFPEDLTRDLPRSGPRLAPPDPCRGPFPAFGSPISPVRR